MSYIHCDKCERECPPFDEAQRQGWYMSIGVSVSGIPLDLICPECVNPPEVNYQP